MNELTFQRELVVATKKEGGHAFKMSHRVLIGVPDLFIQLPGLPTILMECKYCHTKMPLMPTSMTPFNLSVPQLTMLNKIRGAGGKCGVCFMAKMSDQSYRVLMVRDPYAPFSLGEFLDKSFVRKHGTPWPIRAMCEELI